MAAAQHDFDRSARFYYSIESNEFGLLSLTDGLLANVPSLVFLFPPSCPTAPGLESWCESKNKTKHRCNGSGGQQKEAFTRKQLQTLPDRSCNTMETADGVPLNSPYLACPWASAVRLFGVVGFGLYFTKGKRMCSNRSVASFTVLERIG